MWQYHMGTRGPLMVYNMPPIESPTMTPIWHCSMPLKWSKLLLKTILCSWIGFVFRNSKIFCTLSYIAIFRVHSLGFHDKFKSLFATNFQDISQHFFRVNDKQYKDLLLISGLGDGGKIVADQLTLFQQGRGRLCPPHYYLLPPPYIFRPSAGSESKLI